MCALNSYDHPSRSIRREAYLLFYERREDTSIKPVDFEYNDNEVAESIAQIKKDKSLDDIDDEPGPVGGSRAGDSSSSSSSSTAGYYTSTSTSTSTSSSSAGNAGVAGP